MVSVHCCESFNLFPYLLTRSSSAPHPSTLPSPLDTSWKESFTWKHFSPPFQSNCKHHHKSSKDIWGHGYTLWWLNLQLKYLHHLVARFATIWWPKLQPMQMLPPPKRQLAKLVVKFVTNASVSIVQIYWWDKLRNLGPKPLFKTIPSQYLGKNQFGDAFWRLKSVCFGHFSSSRICLMYMSL